MDDDIKDHTNKDCPLDGSKITVTRRVKSPRQPALIEKEIVKLARNGQQHQH